MPSSFPGTIHWRVRLLDVDSEPQGCRKYQANVVVQSVSEPDFSLLAECLSAILVRGSEDFVTPPVEKIGMPRFLHLFASQHHMPHGCVGVPPLVEHVAHPPHL